ncbi:MAG: UDP-N-acetylmuramoyl-L-alanyl-D-glutamate--2,6-diaminopimelate ligase, partial [Clostridia bacterium]|nr:UDP-N-acetylmuramoyl-L-alanyl-D-glutamate--2,6-diaminopimelate ligase [Clostridia bacterium]
MNVKELLSGYGHRVIHENVGQVIHDIQYDSRLIEAGDLFVAIKGYQADGHDYIEKAIEKGATTIVCSDLGKVAPIMEKYHDVQWIFVEDARNALAYMSDVFYDKPSKKMALVGITGTNGKTSVSLLLSNMLEALDKRTGVIGTIGNKVGQSFRNTSVTTPESLNLNRLFTDMVSDKTDACLMEVSSHSLALDRVAFLNYNIGIFTNLTQDHMDFHRDFEEYYSAKRRLFLMTDTYNLINVDDAFGRRIVKDMVALSAKAKSVTYGIDRAADIMARNVRYSMAGVSYDLCTAEFEVAIRVNMPGKIYVYNTLAAIGTLILMGASKEDVLKAVA